MKNKHKNIGVIGLGQIGGSIARALTHQAEHVYGFDTDKAIKNTAQRYGIHVLDSSEDLVNLCSIVFITVSLEHNADSVEHIVRIADKKTEETIITDVASYKKGTYYESSRRPFFIPGHPMAGTEGYGFQSSNPDLFNGANWALIVDNQNDLSHVLDLLVVIQSMRASILLATPDWHDRAVSLISALPHVLSAVLSITAHETEDVHSILRLAAGSFRSGTRVMQSNPKFVQELLFLNKNTLMPLVERALRSLKRIRTSLKNEDKNDLSHLLKMARDTAIESIEPQKKVTNKIIKTRTGMSSLLGLRNKGVTISRVEEKPYGYEIQTKELDLPIIFK